MLYSLRTLRGRDPLHGSLIHSGRVRAFLRFDEAYEVFPKVLNLVLPKGFCTHIIYTLAPKYLCRDCLFKAKLYTIGGHGPLRLRLPLASK